VSLHADQEVLSLGADMLSPLPYAMFLARLVSIHEEGVERGHSFRAAEIADRMVEVLAPDDEDAWLWPAAILVHDVGKLAVPASVLRKPAGLSPEEEGILRTHTTVGRELLEELAASYPVNSFGRCFWTLAALVAGGHHERPDGRGYPVGLAGDAVPPVLRLARLVDVYESLTSRRAYRDGLTHQQALKTMREMGGFDEPLLLALDAATRGYRERPGQHATVTRPELRRRPSRVAPTS
jgi:HD-GYP domain-containing protein (c-di-GMP phosphodiesterase class II)